MDQDQAFEKWWDEKRRSTYAQMIDKIGQERARDWAHEAWGGCLNANRAGPRLMELDWFRNVCADEMGIDAPGGDGCHPLRDLLRELKAVRAEDGRLPFATERLLHELAKKDGPLASLAEAGLLFTRKGEDYNTGFTRDDYFPMGLQSYAQMLWVKAMRLLSFAMLPRKERHEGVRDTCLDLISYAAFCADWLKRKSYESGSADRRVSSQITKFCRRKEDRKEGG